MRPHGSPREDQALLAAFEEWQRSYYINLCNELHALEELRQEHSPGNKGGEFTDEFMLVCDRIPIVDGLIDLFLYGDEEDKVSLYFEQKGAVELAS